MRIAFLAWRDTANELAGGSEQYVDDLCRGLTRRGHEVVLFAGGPVEEHSYPVVDTGSTFGQYAHVPLRHRRALRDVDLVVDVENGIPFWSPLWHRGPRVCVVHHVHTDQWRTRFPRPVAFVGAQVERRAMPLVYRTTPFVAVSPSTADALAGLGVDRDRITVVPNAVRPGPDPVPESTEPLFVVLGRLVPHKRVELALEAWETVRASTGGRLVVIGEGPERERLARRAGAGVTFVGAVDEATKHRLLGEAWLLVHPAMHEGWGIVVTEAGQQRTPTLGFDVAGVRDSVQHGHTGVLAADLDSFVAEWTRLAMDPAERRRLAGNAEIYAQAFTPERTVDRFEAVCLETVLASGPGRPLR